MKKLEIENEEVKKKKLKASEIRGKLKWKFSDLRKFIDFVRQKN